MAVYGTAVMEHRLPSSIVLVVIQVPSIIMHVATDNISSSTYTAKHPTTSRYTYK